MKVIWMIIFLFSLGVTHGQPGLVKVFDDTLNTQSIYKDVLIEDDTIVLYSLSFDANLNKGIRFVKLDSFGNVLMDEIHIDNPALSTIIFKKKIINTSDGGYAVIGDAGGLPYILKVHHDLSLDFLVKYPSSVDFASNASLLETEDGYLLAGRQKNSGEDSDIFVIKTDKNGQQLWKKVYVWNESDDNVFEIKKIDDNSFVLGATQASVFDGTQGTWNKSALFCIDSLGIVKWQWVSDDAPTHGPIIDFERLPDSSWVCISATWELNPNGTTYWTRPIIFRMDKNFNIMWEWKYWKLIPIQFLTDLERTPDGNFLASGWVDTHPDYTNLVTKAIHYKFTPNGDSLWMRLDSIYPDSISDTDGMRVTGTALLSSGSIISVGYARRKGSNAGVFGFLMKISSDGCIDTLNCWPVADYEPFAQAEAIDVYPNPIGDELIVELKGYSPKKTNIFLYDITGRFLRKQHLPDSRNFLNTSDFPKGMIFYVIKKKQRIIKRGKLIKN